MNNKLHTWDFVAVGCYFAAVLAAGVFSMCRSNRGTVSGYFLAGRFMTWLPVGASLFASNIGSEHFIGLAGSGAAAGIAVGAFELNACMLLQLLGWVFLPVYIASGVCTLPEFMKKRFGGNRIHIYLAVLSLILYIFTKISVNLYSGALFIQQALNWNIYLSVLLLLGVTAFCTVTGGLAAVIYTDTLQACVMVIGAVSLMVISLIKVGGYKALYYGYMSAVSNETASTPNATCGLPRKDAWNMLREPLHSDMPWPGFLLGQTPASIWYWCADQLMVQRALAAKSLSHAQGGTIFAGYLKLLPVFIIVIPGMIARVLFPDDIACSSREACLAVCGNPVGCSNIAYPKLVLELMPTGLKGVMLSVMLAALMSDLTSIFNSASTLFTMDIYKNFRRKASVRELMIVGRLFVVIMVGVGIVWIPIIQGMQGGQLYLYIQAIAAYLAPPIAAVYLVAVLWKRGNETGAFWGLMCGFIVGLVRMILDFAYREPACGEPDTRPALLANFHYMYFAMMLFFLTGIIMVFLSYLTDAPSDDQMIRVTFWTRFDQTLREDEKQQIASTSAPEKIVKEDNPLGGAYALNTDERNHILLKEQPSPDGLDKLPKKMCNRGHQETEFMIDEEMNGEVLIKDGMGRPVHNHNEEPLWRRGLLWFCGLQDSEESQQAASEQTEHLKKITSLKQNRRAKLFLLINAFIICFIAIFMYGFFTAGSDFGMYHVEYPF